MIRYEIRIEGSLSDTVQSALGDLQLRSLPTETALVGEVSDDAQLRGIIDLISDLGLRLVALQQLPD